MKCPFCGAEAQLVTQHQVYGRRYGRGGWIWACSRWPVCDSYVGCHPGTTKPLGTMANSALRRARSKAHEAFDPLWKDRHMNRNKAYAKLAKDFGFKVHIGQSDLATCGRIEAWAKEKMQLFRQNK